VTKAEVVKALSAKNIPAEEIDKIGRFFDSLESFKSATDLTGGIEFEKTRLRLLQYVKAMIKSPNP
jgi:hypothetical protein